MTTATLLKPIWDSRPQFDERDNEIVNKFTAARDEQTGPRVGDFIHMTDGTTRRFTHHWGDSLQTTIKGGDASFYLGEGYLSFSGSLDPSIPIDQIEPTDETREGSCWTFHHNWMQAHNGVHFTVPCRVYRQI